jgi:hypothetical protein
MCRVFFLLAAMLTAIGIAGQPAFAESDWLSAEILMKLEAVYLERLDSWVEAGGDVNTVQNEVVANCGKLFYMHVDPARIPNLSPKEKEDYDMLIDVCTKITVTRVHPQPEFENPKIVKLICAGMAVDHPVISKLCQRARVKL